MWMASKTRAVSLEEHKEQESKIESDPCKRKEKISEKQNEDLTESKLQFLLTIK